MKPPKQNSLYPGRKPTGFALVISLALMSLVILLLLAITGLTRVAMQGAEGEKFLLQARQNALLGVYEALGKLQGLTGPDQRITAEAALFAEATTIRQPGWIGVWRSNPQAADPGLEEPLSTADQRDWDQRALPAKLGTSRGWLVSGTSLSPVTGVPAGPDGIDLRWSDTGNPVRAELRRPNTANAFAYHVADESLKARLNLADPHRNSSDATVAEQAALVAQRFAPEAVLNADALARLPAGFDWSSVQSLSQLGLFGIDPTPLEEVFTSSAASVLADVRLGGLRRDLTAIARLPEGSTGRSVFGYGITVDPSALPQALQDNPFLYTIEDLSTETVDGSLPVNPRLGALDNPIQGPRIEALWDFMNHERLISGGRVRPNEAGTPDWLALLNGDVSTTNRNFGGRWLKFEGPHALFSSRSTNVSGGQREISFIHPAEGMALGGKLFFPGPESQLQHNDLELIPERHLLINSGLTPILTELIYYITVSVVDGELILNIHPAAEYTNPYDVAIRPDFDLWWANFLLRLSFDFRLIPKETPAPTPENPTPVDLVERVWSLENGSGSSTPFGRLGGRSLGSLLASSSAVRGFTDADGNIYEEGSVANNASVSLRVTTPRPIFQPGETKGFVARAPSAILEEGADWWTSSVPVKVREYEFGSVSGRHSVIYGDPWPQFDPANSPQKGASLDDYEFIEVRVNSIPLHQQGPDLVALDWHSSGGSQIGGGATGSGAVRMSYHAIRIPLSRARIGAESQARGGASVGNAYVYETSFAQQGGSWASTSFANPDVAVIQLQALSADDFRSGNKAVGGMNDGAENFLGRSNPRAYIMNDRHGFGGERNFEATGWTSAYYSGYSLGLQQIGFWGESNMDANRMRLFHAPRRQPLSLGLLQHWNTAYSTNDPAYLVGSSLPPFANLGRNETVAFHTAAENYNFSNQSLYDFAGDLNVPASFTVRRADFIFDSAFYLNRALWDSWFFSTIPGAVDPQRPDEWPNSRFTVLRPDEPATEDNLLAYDRSAGNLLLKGGFNINSTSEKAWAAVLAARLGLGLDGGSGTSGRLYYPRMPGMTAGGDIWSNTRAIQLSDIYEAGQENNPGADTLSKRIVREIRERGPFLSLSHFINRLLVNDERGEKGALQAAIEATPINSGNNGFDYAPGSVTQGDILGPLGPALTARGDTFVIRTVGEVRDPATGNVVSRSWAEATVQRRPDYVDSLNPPQATADYLGPLTALNQRFGRRYEVVDFRWIDPPQTI